jgi:hypothetical protein
MHASTIFTALFAAVAVAAPASTATNDVAARAADTAELAASAQTMLDAKAAAGCNILSESDVYNVLHPLKRRCTNCFFSECISALAPASITCAAALVEEGLNPIADAACFASALNNLANPVRASNLPSEPAY